jgi:hypothetical protein
VLPTIDLTTKPQEIKIWACNSRLKPIARIKEAEDKSYDINTGRLNELSFMIPLYIDDLQNGIQKNDHADYLIDRSILKVKYGNLEELFMINSHDDSDDGQKRSIHAFSLGIQLGSRYIYNYKSRANGLDMDSPIDIEQAVDDALKISRVWKKGYIDPALKEKFRYFEFDSKSSLEYLYEIGETFGAILVWDTIEKTVNAYHPDNYGMDRGFKITNKNYINSLTKKSSDDEFATRLYLYGKDGLTINSISPTGQSYIDDFTYFMSTGLMSQELLNGINTYNSYVESRKDEFPSLLNQLNVKQNEHATLSSELFSLQTEKVIITDRLDILNASGEKKDYTLTSKVGLIRNEVFPETEKRVVILNITLVNPTDTPTITLNGVTIPYVQGTFDYVGKFVGDISLNVSNISIGTIIKYSFIKISDLDYELTTDELLKKYSLPRIEKLVTSKQTELDNKEVEVNSVLSQMISLQGDLLIDNHLSDEILEELDSFIFEKDYTDENCIDAESLLLEGKKQLQERNKPQVLFDVSLFNFFNFLEEKRNWDKLSIFDIVRLQSDRINVDIKARITNIKISDDSIGLTVANTKNVKDEQDKFINLLYGTASGTKALQKKEYAWDKAVEVGNQFNDYYNSEIDAVKQKIVAGINQTVTIDERGIKIITPDDPNIMLIINNGVIAITHDGGSTWENALTEQGLIAERIIGKLLVSNKLIIENEQGTFSVDGGQVRISSGSLIIDGGITETNIDPDVADKWNNQAQDAINYIMDQELVNYVNTATYSQDMADLQNQLDGAIESWFYEYEPTMSNEPASLWVTEQDKHNHLGDTFTNVLTGDSWRFGNPNGVYKWIVISDSAAQKALQDAAKAQDTADNKRRVFVTTPVPPYDIGDLWVQGGFGDIMRCSNARISGETYVASDWAVASKYTDDTRAIQAESNAKAYADTLKAGISQDIADVSDELTGLSTYVDGAFMDGVITQAESIGISQRINSLNSEKADLEGRYAQVYLNAELTGVAKSDLLNKKVAYNTAHTNLINSINTAIADNAITPTEKSDITSKETAYKTALSNLSASFETAINTIAQAKATKAQTSAQTYADGLKTAIDSEIQDVIGDVSALNTYVDGSFKDGIISEAEAKAIEKYINQIDSEKKDIDSRYTAVYNATELTNATEKTSLNTAKTNYDTAHTNLKTSINTAISDGKTSATEKTDVDAKFTTYHTRLGELSTAFENAITKIAQTKVDNFASSKFSGANGSLPAGTVSWANGTTSTTIEQAALNFNNRNDRITTKPANPTIATNGSAIDHTINTDGSVDISFEWTFNGTGNAYDIDGFIVYVFAGVSSSAYSFGSSISEEDAIYVLPEKRAIILKGISANKYYTFGVQSYRIVDKDIDSTGVLKSSIIKSSATGENPYRPESQVAFAGNITGTLNNTPVSTVVTQAGNALQLGTTYNKVTFDANSGITAQRTDNKVRTILNATDGVKIQTSADGGNTWTDKFYADSSGVINAVGLKLDNTSSLGGTTVTVLKDSINSKVEQDGVISSINQTAEAIKINASKVDITGAVTFNSFDSDMKQSVTNWNDSESLLNSWKSGTTLIDGGMVATNSIFANSLAVGDFTNLIGNGDFENDTANELAKGWRIHNSSTTSYVSDQSSWSNNNGSNKCLTLLAHATINNDVIQDVMIPVKEGDELYFEWEYRNENTLGTGIMRFGTKNYNAKKVHYSWGSVFSTTTKTTTWTKMNGSYTVPSGVSYVELRVVFEKNGESTNRLFVDNLVVRRKGTGALLVNGTIEAGHIKSLNGLNVNDQFVVDANGNVTLNKVTGKELTITRTDGYNVINNGVANFDFATDAHDPPFRDSGVTIEGYWFRTSSTSPVSGNYYTFKHNARYLKMQIAYYKTGTGNTGGVRIAKDGGTMLAAKSFTTGITHQNAIVGEVFTVDLGVPTGSIISVYLQGYQDIANGNVYFRKIRSWLEG